MNVKKNNKQFFTSKKPYNILVLFLFAIILFYSILSLPFFSEGSWNNINIKNLRVDGSNRLYSLRGGMLVTDSEERRLHFEFNPQKLIENNRVIRLAMYKTIENEDPFFTSNIIDYSDYAAAIDNLERVNIDLIKEMEIKDSGLPISFLKELKDLLKIKNEFSKNTSFEAANKLNAQYEKVIDKYISDSKRLLELVRKSKIEESYFAQTGAVTSQKIIVSDIEKIITNGSNLKHKLATRKACLSISPIFCAREIFTEKLETLEARDLALNGTQVIAPNLYPSIKDTDKLVFNGPYLVNSNCWPGEFENDNHLLYLIEDNTTSLVKIMPEFANNAFYQKISLENRGPFLYKQFQKKSMDWERVALNTPYACNDLRYYGEISTLDSYLKEYTKPITDGVSHSESNDSLKELSSFEANFYNSEIKSSADLNLLGQAYQKYYIKRLKGDNSYESIDLGEILQRSNHIKSKIAYLNKNINYQAYLLEMYIQTNGKKLRPDEDTKISYDSYLYLMHSFYAVSFLSNSPFTLKDAELTYIDKENSRMRSDIVNMQEIKKIISQEELNKINSINRNRIVNEVSSYEIK